VRVSEEAEIATLSSVARNDKKGGHCETKTK
jgi:hypothetical protein